VRQTEETFVHGGIDPTSSCSSAFRQAHIWSSTGIKKKKGHLLKSGYVKYGDMEEISTGRRGRTKAI